MAQIFGVAHLSMLSGFVFLSHQVGSFLGVWLGGFLYDRTGSYDVVWYIAIALGVFAALVNLPVRESADRARRAATGLRCSLTPIRMTRNTARIALHCAWPRRRAAVLRACSRSTRGRT